MITPANIERAAEAAHQLNRRLSQLRGYYASSNHDHPTIADHVATLHRQAEEEFRKLVETLEP